MIANDIFDACFGTVPPGDPEHLSKVIKNAVRNGFAVVIDKPGQKVPMCTLTARDMKAADNEVQQAAKERGDVKWADRKHPCGLNHAITDEADAVRVTTRLAKKHDHLNIGIELGRSRMLVVDVDTASENAAFLAAWSAATGQDESSRTMTVLSPGAARQLPDGSTEWVHKDGGHYWFTLPSGVELPDDNGILKGEGGWAAMWRDRQVLVPPSVRAEGAYVLAGQTNPAPEWLVDMILADSTRRREVRAERAERASQEDNPIDRWAATASWTDLLTPDGWTDTGMVDRCSCPVWTAPGAHSSPKSATAHDLGCDHYDLGMGHGPLHVWTDNPPEHVAAAMVAKGSRTITKLTYLSYRFYEGNDGNALRAMGVIESEPFGPTDFFAESFTYEPAPPPSSAPAAAVGDDEDADDTPASTAVEKAVDGILDRFLGKFLTLDQMDNLPELQPLIEGVMDLDTVNRVIGKSNHGKTFFMIDVACHIAAGKEWCGRKVVQGPVVYMAAEGALGFRKRARAWEKHHGIELGDSLMILPEAVQIMRPEFRLLFSRAMAELKPVMVVLDTQARITVGAEENSAKDMGLLVDSLEVIRQECGAAVVVVHHLGHAGEHGRGSTAVYGAVSTEIRVERQDGGKGQVVAHCSKQKDGEFFDPIPMDLVSVEGTDSAVLVGPDTHDPFAAPAIEQVPMWQKMARHIHDTAPTVGVTQAKACSLAREAFGAGQSTVYKAWDALMRKGVLTEILDDKDKGTGRYVVSSRELERHAL